MGPTLGLDLPIVGRCTLSLNDLPEVKITMIHAQANRERHAHDHGHGEHGHHHHHGPQPSDSAVKDPVCGMTVDTHTTKHRAQHRGKPYYFCSAGCRSKFTADPAKYTGHAQAPKAEAVPEGTIHTCPMH